MIGTKFQLNALTAITDVAGPGGTAKLHLVKDDYLPQEDDTVANLLTHEADYTGYAAATVDAWGGAYLDADGKATVTAECVQFQPTDDAKPNVIYAWWLEGGTAPNSFMIRYVRLPESVGLVDADHALHVAPAIVYPQE